MAEAEAPADYFDAKRERVLTLMNRLNNEVSVGDGFLGFLREDKPRLTPQQREWMATVEASAEKSSAILRELYAALFG